jgi:serine/threonine protein phosphatase PrpC
MFIIESAGLTDVGKRRKGNEDALLVDDALGLYVVADGMGGHQAGEVASRLVVESIRDYMKRFSEGISVEELQDTDTSLSRDANRILAGINLSNRVVHEIAGSKAAYTGMGSTVSVVYFTDQTLVAANVGDSPIYLVQNDRIELLSEPHTVVAEHAAIDPEGAKQLSGEFKHMLTRAMGTEATVKANVCELPYFKDDVLVMSSDGLSDLVRPEEIMAIAGDRRPDAACRALVDLANERGGIDNITVIVLKVKRTGSGNGKMRNLLSRMTDGFSNIKGKKKFED